MITPKYIKDGLKGCLVRAMWKRQFGLSKKVIKRLLGLKPYYIHPVDRIFIEKARDVISWIELPENIECKRHNHPQDRNSKEYHEWRIAVLIRDKWVCQQCGTKKNLHIHHKMRYKEYPKLRLNIDNGITLCKDCHVEAHRCPEIMINSA